MQPLAAEGGIIKAAFGSFDTTSLWVVLAISVLALLFGFYLRSRVLAADEGTEKMREVAGAIQEGSAAYLRRQFKTLAVFGAVLLVVLFFLPVNQHHDSVVAVRLGRSLAFLIGALFSATTGFTGMWLSVRGNVRVAAAAKDKGYRAALTLAFRTGGVAGMFTVGLGLLGATALLIVYKEDAPNVLVGLGFGAALIAMFMRVGGGIFTKAADVGADLVGKVEQGIPEDDPRNAAVIADNVGDNVGDCAGMAADLFESYEVTLVAAIILGAAAYGATVKGVIFPLLIQGIGILTAMVGILAVTPRSDREPGMKAINRGFFVSAVLSASGVLIVSLTYMKSIKPFLAVLIGLVLTVLIQIVTEHYTSTTRRPVKDIARSTLTGPATTVLSGIYVGLESAVWGALLIGTAIIGDFYLGGGDLTHLSTELYYVALSGMGVLSVVGVVVSMDTFGPVSDNAQGIAEMSGEFEGEASDTLTNLDAIGNSTKAITKGVAIATAVLAATSLFGSFRETILGAGAKAFAIDLISPKVLVGLLIGGCVTFMFCALAIRAVGRAAFGVVMEVRRQFREHPGIMTYEEKPEYAKVVDLVTKASLRELITPGLMAVLAPIFVGFALGPDALGGFLGGAIITGQLMAVFLSNSGGAWDNAKKLIEEGTYGGKGSKAHEAAVIGDTVGDPFKDTAGPAMNPLIKVMNLVALLIAGLVVSASDDIGVRIAVAVVAAGVIAWALWFSKNISTGAPDEVQGPPAGGVAAAATASPSGATAASPSV
jgi:K(+)-stimulated pyrophosphate-energized sodium pump